jgi:SAM-dependent methyltransferase
MNEQPDYINLNRTDWNRRTDVHWESDFYDNKAFIEGADSLKEIEKTLLGDIRGKRILHLQCHFGQDTLSLARLGAIVTGVDLSDRAIDRARELAKTTKLEATFICCDLYDLPAHLEGQFDMVYTSYGTIGWLPDLTRWAKIIAHYLKPDGQLVFVEFHPVVWMYDDAFATVAYGYFNTGPIIETHTGTYADRDSAIQSQSVGWNHPLSDVFTALLTNGLTISSFREYDFSPYNVFHGAIENEPGRYRLSQFPKPIPMVYSIIATN